MKINNVSVCSFRGVKEPYKTWRGVQIIPISKDPDKKEIKEAIKTTEAKKPTEGFNGEVYWLGQDKVVKKYKGESALIDDPMREAEILNQMYDTGLRFDNSQRGLYAFSIRNGDFYTVSTKVEGETPNAKTNPFKKENLASLMKIIIQMDAGCKIEGSSKEEGADECRFMNYDFNAGNINITDTKAGMFDFEYAKAENIDDMIKEKIKDRKPGINCHRSDTSELPSNLRSFEFYALSYYLETAENPRELFNDYLTLKSDYHERMKRNFEKLARTSKYPEECKYIAKKEENHSKILKRNYHTKQIPEDIQKSEAIKIQMAKFVHEQSPYCTTKKINPEQIKQFSEDSLQYFGDKYRESLWARNEKKQEYFQDCFVLMYNWSEVNDKLEEKIKAKDSDTMKKLTTEHIPTLLDILNFQDDAEIL